MVNENRFGTAYTFGQEAPGEWALGIVFLLPLPSRQASQVFLKAVRPQSSNPNARCMSEHRQADLASVPSLALLTGWRCFPSNLALSHIVNILILLQSFCPLP